MGVKNGQNRHKGGAGGLPPADIKKGVWGLAPTARKN